MNPEEKEEIYKYGFLKTVIENNYWLYNHRLTLLLYDYHGIELGGNYDLTTKLERIFKSKPETADKVLSELDAFLLNPEEYFPKTGRYADSYERDWYPHIEPILIILFTAYNGLPNHENVSDKIDRCIILLNKLKNFADHRNDELKRIQEIRIKHQQDMLMANPPAGLSLEGVSLLTSSPPQLPWELNTDNTSAAGYWSSFFMGEGAIHIPARDELLKLYPELMKQAEQNKQKSPSDLLDEIKELTRTNNIDISDIDMSDIKLEECGDDIDLVRCPISLSLMEDPVTLGDTGHTFDRVSIERSLNARPHINPLTNEEIENVRLIPNTKSLGLIKCLLERHIQQKELTAQEVSVQTQSELQSQLKRAKPA